MSQPTAPQADVRYRTPEALLAKQQAQQQGQPTEGAVRKPG